MSIILKSRREIEMMRRAGNLAHEITYRMVGAVAAGVTTRDLDEIARVMMQQAGATSGSLNYPTYKPGEGYPGWTCLSVNEEVVHGVPDKRQLKDGDIITVDVALKLDGYCADMATTVAVGKISHPVQKLLDVTKGTLDLALQMCKPGLRWSEIARAMQKHVEKAGFSVVREFVGHGVGRLMHEDPKVPNFVAAEQAKGDFVLRPGMTFAIEPMVAMGRRDVLMLPDGWTVVTEDRRPAAHFEHTVGITETGADVLTLGAEVARSVEQKAASVG